MIPLCDLCGTRHHGYQGHVFASNAASNVGGVRGDQVEGCLAAVSVIQAAHGDDNEAAGGGLGGKQRWSRESYNAYQREYMRKRRSKNKK